MTRAWLFLIWAHALLFAVAFIGCVVRAGGADAGAEPVQGNEVRFCFRQLNPDGGEPLPLPAVCLKDPRIGGIWSREVAQ